VRKGRRESGEAGKRVSNAAGQRVKTAGASQSSTGARGAPVVHQALGTENPLASQPIEFVGSFPDPTVRVEPVLPEIAFIGRSNVGKSSLINALVGRPGLARVSGSPGKTSLLNFYRLPRLYLVDLPGYGFARASKSSRAAYRQLIYGYVSRREALAGVVWLLDIRRDPSPEDQSMQGLLTQSGRPVLVVLTKADKLTRSARTLRVRQLADALGLPLDHIELTSSQTGLGVAELATSVAAAAGGTS
jgi:GTP-binding protein